MYSENERSQELQILLVLLAITVFGALLRFYQIDKLPLWDAEAVTYWFSRQSVDRIWNWITEWDFHPPLFHTLLKAWGVFGESEAALRSLSAACSIVTIPLIFLIGRLVAGPRYGDWVGIASALLLAVSPLHIEYAQEARYQAAWGLASTLVIFSTVWLLRRPDSATGKLLGCGPAHIGYEPQHTLAPQWLPWAALIGSAALSLWLHNLSTLLLLTIAVVLLVWWVGPLQRNSAFIVNCFLAGTVVLILWSPFLRTLLVQSSNLSQQFSYPPPTFMDIAHTIDFWFGVTYLHYASFVPLAVLSLYGAWKIAQRSGWGFGFLIASVIAGPLILVVAISLLFKPILLYRTMTWINIPYFVAIAAGIRGIETRWLRNSVLAGCCALLLAGTLNYYSAAIKAPWDKIARLIAEGSGENGLVLTIPNVTDTALEYYLRREGSELPIVGLPRPFPAPNLPNPYPYDVTTGPAMTVGDVPFLRDHIADRSPVWYVPRAPWLMDPEDLILRTLHETKTLSETREFFDSDDELFGKIPVYKFE